MMNTIPDQQPAPVEMPLLLETEVKILFGLTGRQALILLCGISLAFTTWETSSAFHSIAGAVLLFCLCGVSAVPIAFLKVQEKPLEVWLFILLAWLFVPDHVPLKTFLRLFMRVRSLSDGIVTLSGDGKHLDYLTVICVEPRAVDLLSGAEQALMIEAFGRMLDGLSYPITIHIRSLPESPAVLSSTIITEQLARPVRRFHAHYLSFLSQLVREKRPVDVRYYIVVPATIQAEKDEGRRRLQAKGQLANRVQEIDRELARAGLSCRSLDTQELFAFYREGFTSSQVQMPDAIPELLVPPLTMALSGSSFSLHEAGGAQYMSCLELASFPRMVHPGWLARVIADLHEPYIDMSLHIGPHVSDEIAAKLKRKAVLLGGTLLAAKGGSEEGNTLTRYALKDVERMRDQLLRQDSHMYSIALVLRVRARSQDELRKREERIQLAMRSVDFQVRKLRFRQHIGYFSTLAYGQNLLHTHLLPTNAVSSFFPFSHVPVMENEREILLGTTHHGNFVSYDPWRSSRLNANLAVLGVPGAGKSFFLKTILSRLAASTDLSIIDVEDEYSSLVLALGGQRIELTADSFHLNPLELQAQGEQTFREKIAALVGFFALLIGEGGVLTRHESAIMEHCLIQVYAARGITVDPLSHTRPAPGMKDVANALQGEPSGSELALRLSGCLHLFPRSSSLSKSKHTVYSLKQLPEALRPAATYILTERLWSQLQVGRQDGTRHLVVIDEAWFLTKYEAGATLLNDFARRVRKYNGALWLGTQQLTDLLASEQGKNLLALCETKMLFRQDISSIDIMRNALHLSAAQSQYMQTARQGEALMMTSTNTLALDIVASEQETAIAITTQHV